MNSSLYEFIYHQLKNNQISCATLCDLCEDKKDFERKLLQTDSEKKARRYFLHLISIKTTSKNLIE